MPNCNNNCVDNCNDCNDAQLYYIPCSESPVDTGCVTTVDTQCVVYNGDPLSCINVQPGTRLEGILQLMDAAICAGAPDNNYATYNTFCMTGITTQKKFVETISELVCNTATSLATLSGTTIVDIVDGLQVQIDDIVIPGIMGCAAVSIPNGSTLKTILQTYSDKLCDLYNKINLDSVNWSQCLTVTVPPTTIAGGFSTVIDQICQVRTSINTITSDTYKVKTGISDANPDFLANKILGSPCISVTTYIDAGVSKILLTLAQKIQKFNYDPTQFNVTETGVDSCTETRQISIKPEILTAGGVTCSNVNSVFADVITAQQPLSLYGATSESCYKFDFCGIRNWIFGDVDSGNYMLSVDTSKTDCTRVTLVAPPTGTDWVDISGLIIDGVGYSMSPSNTDWDSHITNPVSIRINSNGDIQLKGIINTGYNLAGDNETFNVDLKTMPICNINDTGLTPPSGTNQRVVFLQSEFLPNTGDPVAGFTMEYYLVYDCSSGVLSLMQRALGPFPAGLINGTPILLNATINI